MSVGEQDKVVFLLRQLGPMTARELYEQGVGSDLSYLSHVLRLLEGRGLVRRIGLRRVTIGPKSTIWEACQDTHDAT